MAMIEGVSKMTGPHYDGTISEQLSLLDSIEPAIENTEKPNKFVTESGVKLTLQKVNHQLAVDAETRVKEPIPPQVYLKDEDRWIENPNSPTYQAELTRWRDARYEMNYNIYLGLGVVNDFGSLPSGVHPQESDDWLEILDFLNIARPQTRLARKIAWLRYHVFSDSNEVQKCIHKIAVYSGLAPEAEVQQAVETFPGDETHDTDNGASVSEHS